jgi:gas vesicle protein
MIFAQLEHVPAATIKDVLLIVIGVGGFIFAAAAFFERRKSQKREITPQPLLVAHDEPCARKSELEQHIRATRDSFDQIRDELKTDRHDNQEHASKRSKTLFDKVEAVRTELDTKIEESRRELTEKIDDVPDRVIATLKNTGAI